jgi:hypothetical protein
MFGHVLSRDCPVAKTQSSSGIQHGLGLRVCRLQLFTILCFSEIAEDYELTSALRMFPLWDFTPGSCRFWSSTGTIIHPQERFKITKGIN